MKLYSIKNTQTQRFNPPFVARDDDDAIETCRKAIIGGRDVSLLVELDNLVLYDIGSFSSISGRFTCCENGTFEDDVPLAFVSLCEIPLPEHIQKMIDKLKEVKE